MATLREIVRFGVGGFANFGLSYLMYLFLLKYFQATLAFTIAYIFGILLSYAINMLFVFRRALSLSSALRFPIVYGVQYLIGLAAIWVLVDLNGVDSRLAGFCAATLSALGSFYLIRRIVA